MNCKKGQHHCDGKHAKSKLALAMSNTPTPDKRPDVEGIKARAEKAVSIDPLYLIAHQDIPALIAYIGRLEEVVKAARDCADKEHLENRVALAGARTGAPIITARIPAKLWNPVLKAIADLDGEGDG